MKIYIHHSAYNLSGPQLPTVDAQHEYEDYPESAYGYFTFYQYFIERSGKIVQCRPDFDPDVVYKPEHTNSISICLAGNFNEQLPTTTQEFALGTLLLKLRQKYGFVGTAILPHRVYQTTSCYGNLLANDWAAKVYIKAELNFLYKTISWLLLQLRSNILSSNSQQLS